MERSLAALAVAWLLCGCGQTSRPVDVPDREPVSQTDSMTDAVSATDDVVVPTTAATASRISPPVREEIDLFAYSLLQIQRVTQLQEGSVQRELKLTDDQIASFARLGKEVKQMSSTLQTLSGEQRREKLMNDYRPKATEYEQLVDAALDDAQERLLLQRVLQRQRGAITFVMPGIPEELDLTDEQVDFLYDLIESTRQSVNFDNLSNPIELGRIAYKASAARKKAEEQLTAEQRVAWDGLRGD
ncbi:MAG: hypothetical protein SH850_19895 [Planctomycetaceae bacterium]|nr:hypothetical protein [Planctomycetaceae bacterium]